jgi:hypothetical protein
MFFSDFRGLGAGAGAAPRVHGPGIRVRGTGPELT